MRHLRQHTTTIVVAMITAAVTASAPALAAAVAEAVNADTVDRKHAVSAGASPANRAGKLVATNAAGRLPNSIIAKAPNAERLDGLDSTAFLRKTAKAANADKLDGIDSSQLQFFSLDLYGAYLQGPATKVAGTATAGIELGDSASTGVNFTFTLPPDYVTGTDLFVRVVWDSPTTACTVILGPNLMAQARPGQSAQGSLGAVTGGGTITINAGEDHVRETIFTLLGTGDESPLQAGDAYAFGFYRAGPMDSCASVIRVRGVSVSY